MPNPRVILIDDEPGVLLALKLMLKAMGAEVETFNGGQSGLQRVLQDPPYDFVICDLRMPDFDGFEVLRGLRKAKPSVPFILMSGHATSEDVAQAKQLGMTDFLGKPFSPEEIKRVLNLAQ